MSTKHILHALNAKNLPAATSLVEQTLRDKLTHALANERIAVAKTLVKEATTGVTKKALIREPGFPVGQPAPMYLMCVCGMKLSVPEPFVKGVRCGLCGQKYDASGWLIEAALNENYKCLECGKKYKNPVEECSKCGGSDIDLSEDTDAKTKVTKNGTTLYRTYDRNGKEIWVSIPEKELNEGSQPPADWNKGFTYPYQIGGGGKETPFIKNGKWYLYVFNMKTRKHEYYSYSDDMYLDTLNESRDAESAHYARIEKELRKHGHNPDDAERIYSNLTKKPGGIDDAITAWAKTLSESTEFDYSSIEKKNGEWWKKGSKPGVCDECDKRKPGSIYKLHMNNTGGEKNERVYGRMCADCMDWMDIDPKSKTFLGKKLNEADASGPEKKHTMKCEECGDKFTLMHKGKCDEGCKMPVCPKCEGSHLDESRMPATEVQRVYNETGDVTETELLCGVSQLRVTADGTVLSFVSEAFNNNVKAEVMTVGEFKKRWMQVKAYRDQLAGLPDDAKITVHIQSVLGQKYVAGIDPLNEGNNSVSVCRICKRREPEGYIVNPNHPKDEGTPACEDCAKAKGKKLSDSPYAYDGD